MLPGGTRPFLTASTIHSAALYPAESGEVNCGLPVGSSTVPPKAPVVSYQYVERPSAAANGMLSGYLVTPLSLICCSAAVYFAIVCGAGSAPAFLNMSVFT